MKNNVNRELPEDLMKQLDYKPFETTEIGHPEVQRVAPKVTVTTGDDKVVESLEDVVKKTVRTALRFHSTTTSVTVTLSSIK